MEENNEAQKTVPTLSEENDQLQKDLSDNAIIVSVNSSRLSTGVETTAYQLSLEMENYKNDFVDVSNKITSIVETSFEGKKSNLVRKILKDAIIIILILLGIFNGLILYLLFYRQLHLIDNSVMIISIFSMLSFSALLVYNITNNVKESIDEYENNVVKATKIYLSRFVDKNSPTMSNHKGKLASLTKFFTLLTVSTIDAASVVSNKVASFMDLQKKLSEFEVFKEELKYSLSRYLLLSPEVSREINAFQSTARSRNKWVEQAAIILSKNIRIADKIPTPKIFQLIFYESNDENLKNIYWNKMNRAEMEIFLEILSERVLAKDARTYNDKMLIRKVMYNVKDDFSLHQVTSAFYIFQEKFKSDNQHFMRTLEFAGKRLSEPPIDYYVVNLQETEKFDFDAVSLKVGIKAQTLSLLFKSFKFPERKIRFSDIENKIEFSTDVTDSLFETNRVPLNLYKEEVMNIILNLDRFDPEEIFERLNAASNFVAIAEKVKGFLLEIKIPIALDFVRSSILIPKNAENKGIFMEDKLDFFKDVFLKLIDWSGLQVTENLGKNSSDKISEILVVIFVNRNHDSDYTLFNKKASSDWVLTKALYLFSQKSSGILEQEIGNTIIEALEVALSSETEKVLTEDSFFLEFRRSLSEGHLPSYPALVSTIFTNNLSRLEKDAISDHELKEMKVLINNLLDESLSPDRIRNFILGRAIQAYMITVPSSADKPAIFAELDKREQLLTLAKSMSAINSEPNYLQLVNYKKGSGMGTRIGLIPYEMSFERFSDLFDDLLTNYFKNTPYPIFLTKISMSETSSQILVRRNESEGIFDVIKGLIKEYYPERKQLALYGSTMGSDVSTTARDLVIYNLNSKKSNISILLDPTHLAAAKNVMANFDIEELTKILFKEFKVESTLDFCRLIHDNTKLDGRRPTIEKLMKIMQNTLNLNGEEYQFQSLSKEIVSMATKVSEYIIRTSSK